MRIGVDASRADVSEPTGTERYSFEVITRIIRLPEAKHQEWILYVRSNFQETITKIQTNSNIQVIQIPMRYLWTQVGLAYRTWVDKLDVLWVPAHTLPVLRKPGVKTVVTIHGIEYEWLPAYENALQRWYLPISTKYAVLSAKKIIAVSEFTKGQLVERLGADPNKIDVVYEGVSRNFQFSKSNFQIISKKFNLQKKKYILFVGTVQPRKNLERLIEAFSKLNAKHYKLVLCGKLGWRYEGVVELAKKHGVVMTGYINDADRYILLQNALVYVQPSITEGFGLPVLEAMAASVPVAASRGGALSEILKIQYPMFDQVMFDPLDVEDMAKKIGTALKSEKLREMMIKEGTKIKFSWDKAARETYNILTNW